MTFLGGNSHTLFDIVCGETAGGGFPTQESDDASGPLGATPRIHTIYTQNGRLFEYEDIPAEKHLPVRYQRLLTTATTMAGAATIGGIALAIGDHMYGGVMAAVGAVAGYFVELPIEGQILEARSARRVLEEIATEEFNPAEYTDREKENTTNSFYGGAVIGLVGGLITTLSIVGLDPSTTESWIGAGVIIATALTSGFVSKAIYKGNRDIDTLNQIRKERISQMDSTYS